MENRIENGVGKINGKTSQKAFKMTPKSTNNELQNASKILSIFDELVFTAKVTSLLSQVEAV